MPDLPEHAMPIPDMTYCWCTFHFECGGVHVMEMSDAIYVICETCRKMGQIELVGHHVTADECKKVLHG